MSAKLYSLRSRIGGTISGSRGWFPGPGHSRDDRSMSLLDAGGRIFAYSFSGDDETALASHLRANGVEIASRTNMSRDDERALRAAQAAARAQDAADQARRRARAKWLWEHSEILPAPALAYLSARDLDPCEYLGHLPAGKYAASIIAPVVNPGGDLLGVHMTEYCEDGHAISRKMLAPQSGGCVRLCESAPTLAIAEGIETALSFTKLHGVPCWAARSATGLEQWRPPSGVQHVIIAADADAQGLKSADVLKKMLGMFACVDIAAAPDGQDWNDVLRGKI